MADPKGSKLYVNLNASQTRRRLKGFGHGVRKVQSAGRNQAVVIHTATGDHLRELERKFADVGCSASAQAIEDPIDNLRNLGPASAQWLRSVQIATIPQLRQIGPVIAYRRVKQQFPQASMNLLWSLAAGLEDRDWRELSDAQKESLREQVRD